MTTRLVLCAVASSVCGARAILEQPVIESDAFSMLQKRASYREANPCTTADCDVVAKVGAAKETMLDSGSLIPEAFSYVRVDEHEQPLKKSSSKKKTNARSSNEQVTPVLVVKLSHAGSSWFTAMLQTAPDIYLEREGITNLEWSWDSLTKLVNYTNEALSRPRGQYWNPDTPDWTGGSYWDPNATDNWQYLNYPKATQECLDHFDDCRMPVTGFTLALTDDIVDNYKTFFQKVTDVHPDLKVVIYRRSNVVKRAFGQGGSDSDQKLVYEPVNDLYAKGHGRRRPSLRPCSNIESVKVNELLQRVSVAVRQDQELLRIKTLFPDALVINYEELQNDVVPSVDKTLRYLGIPYRLKVMKIAADQSYKRDEDLSTYFDKATWQSFRIALQKWYPSTLPMLESKVEGELFDPPTEGNCTPACNDGYTLP